MATKIFIKHGSGAPSADDLHGSGELAIDMTNKLIYTKDLNNNVVALGADIASSDISWDQLTDVPTEFPPEAHEHNYTEINDGAGGTLNVKLDDIDAILLDMQADIAALEGNLAFGGTVDMTTDTITSLTDASTDKGFALGNIPTPPPTGSESIYFIVEKGGDFGGEEYNSGDWLVSQGDSGWSSVNFDATVTVTWDEIGGKPTEFPPEAHTHVMADITDLQTALDDKAEADHTHEIDDVNGLQAALDAKANMDSISGGTY